MKSQYLSAAQTLLLFNIFSSTKLTFIAYSLTCISVIPL